MMMMFHSQLPELKHFPATEALSSVFLDHNEKHSNSSVDRTLPSVRFSTGAKVLGVKKRPRIFDISEMTEATQNIERSMEFPLIHWSFEEKASGASSGVYGGKWMHSAPASASSSAKRRRSRGVVRSISSYDLSEMLVDNLLD